MNKAEQRQLISMNEQIVALMKAKEAAEYERKEISDQLQSLNIGNATLTADLAKARKDTVDAIKERESMQSKIWTLESNLRSAQYKDTESAQYLLGLITAIGQYGSAPEALVKEFRDRIGKIYNQG